MLYNFSFYAQTKKKCQGKMN